MKQVFLRTKIHWFTQKRFYKDQLVRVRFAPSPTGFLHLGGLRTALYNYLFARANGGAFILRIEDTDQSRIVPGACEKLRDDLIWAGIIPDEDPVRGGPFGPYVQSKRLDIYNKHVQILLENASAYYCFCSEHRLEMLRKHAIATRQTPKYDNRCRSLTPNDVESKRKQGMKPCVRFKLPVTKEIFHDFVFGTTLNDINHEEGDPVILKSDNYPTYHFASVVDDHLMEISHVLRGVEWQISTPKHLLLYKAFGWTLPKFGHLPLLLNSDNTKISKRQDDIRVDYFRKNEIFPLALLNYITDAGGGFNRIDNIHSYFSYEDLIKQFDVTKINTNSTKLCPTKLLEFNKLEIINLLNNKKNHTMLINRVKLLIKEKFVDGIPDTCLNLDDNYILSILMWAKQRITKLSDLVSPGFAFLWVLPSIEQIENDVKHKELIDILVLQLLEINVNNFDKEHLKVCLQDFSKKNKIPFPELMKTLRTILSGLKEGPGVGEMMEILGREATINRLKRCNSK